MLFLLTGVSLYGVEAESDDTIGYSFIIAILASSVGFITALLALLNKPAKKNVYSVHINTIAMETKKSANPWNYII